MGLFKPTRLEALTSQSDDEVICDLDAVISNRITFTFQGRTHVLLPITTEVYFDFWAKMSEFLNRKDKTADETNVGFHKIIQIICTTVTLQEVERMTVVQKSVLVQSLTAKIVGNKDVFESMEKKKPVTLVTPHAFE